MLKNFIKIQFSKEEQTYCKIFDLMNNEYTPYTQFSEYMLSRYSKTTRDRYEQVIVKFLDYLSEINFLDQIKTKREIKEVVDKYILLLSRGKNIEDSKLKNLAQILDINEISSKSWSNTIAGINLFFEKHQDWADEEREYFAHKNNLTLPFEIVPLLNFLSNTKILNKHEISSLRQKSIISNLVRKNGPIKVTKFFKSPTVRDTEDSLDFPAIFIPDLLLNTTSYRDRAIYSLLAGCGLRSSEVLNLTWDCIDLENQKIYIKNPAKDKNIKNKDEIKFKGRKTKETFFIPELKHIFFESLYLYQKNEAVFPTKHNFVFQYIIGDKKGEPYFKVSRSAFTTMFHNVVKKAKLNTNIKYTPHSLRHFYGVYMLNYIPLQGKNGFSIEEVQVMMGHKSIIVTQQYAKKSVDYIMEQLELAHIKIDGTNISIEGFNKMLTNKLLHPYQLKRDTNV